MENFPQTICLNDDGAWTEQPHLLIIVRLLKQINSSARFMLSKIGDWFF
jgi:hypothetical protein